MDRVSSARSIPAHALSIPGAINPFSLGFTICAQNPNLDKFHPVASGIVHFGFSNF